MYEDPQSSARGTRVSDRNSDVKKMLKQRHDSLLRKLKRAKEKGEQLLVEDIEAGGEGNLETHTKEQPRID